MLHMQHANVVALLARQHEAARLKARRDAAARVRRAATAGAVDPETGAVPPAIRRTPNLHRPRPA